jgi:hypothetical protein
MMGDPMIESVTVPEVMKELEGADFEGRRGARDSRTTRG